MKNSVELFRDGFIAPLEHMMLTVICAERMTRRAPMDDPNPIEFRDGALQEIVKRVRGNRGSHVVLGNDDLVLIVAGVILWCAKHMTLELQPIPES